MSETRLTLYPARDHDLDAIAALVNASYRGEGGWTNETAFLSGPRTLPDSLREDLSTHPGATLLVYRDIGAPAEENPSGVVRVEPIGAGLWELSMLAIRPQQQDRKLGRALLDAAEVFIADHGGRCIEITVLNIRLPLIAWYERRGYRETGESRSFPYRGAPFGAPTRDDLAFVVMLKTGGRESAR